MRLFSEPTQSVADNFLVGLEKTISIMSKPSKNVKSTFYKPSSLNCLRMMFYYRKGTSIDDINRTSSSVGVLQSGEDRHLRIQEAITKMKENGFDCEWVDVETYIKDKNLINLEVISKKEYETTVHNKELDLLFLCDGVVKIGNQYYIIEIKTENSNSFYNRISVSEDHKHQATCYSLSFNINRVIFIYENRDFCLKKAFLFTVTDKLKAEVVGMINSCNDCVSKNELPIKIICKFCNYCDYKNKCAKDEV